MAAPADEARIILRPVPAPGRSALARDVPLKYTLKVCAFTLFFSPVTDIVIQIKAPILIYTMLIPSCLV